MRVIICQFIFILLINAFICSEIRANSLILSNQTAQKGDEVVFELSIDNAPNDVTCFGFQVVYPADHLQFKPDEYEIGQLLLDDFGSLRIGEDNLGLIRIGWHSNKENFKIPKHASDVLLKLKFTILSCQNANIELVSLVDHFNDWSVRNGHFQIDENSFCRLDINGDNVIGLPEIIGLIKYLADEKTYRHHK
ncbi:MAG: hypothetical protein HQK75_08430 [Candidatus Magnetomorum sp.]|nr:hypothetical protein [Candidatus Magnetomorum sp.]